MKLQNIAAIVAVPLLALAVACSSSSSTTAASKASASATAVSGTETMTGTVTGAAAVASSTTKFALKLSGPVATTATWTTPGGNQTKNVVTTFYTAKGNLVVLAQAPDSNNPPTQVNNSTCYFKSTVSATYVVTGSKSTGVFKGATGSSKVTVVFAAYGPKLSDGKCNEANSAHPLAKGAYSTFSSSGPLTVKG